MADPESRTAGGRVVLVTGSARGLGLACARHLAALSARVAGGEIACVLSEGPETEALARTIIGSSNTPLATVYPLGWTIPLVPEFYASHLKASAREIAACVSRG